MIFSASSKRLTRLLYGKPKTACSPSESPAPDAQSEAAAADLVDGVGDLHQEGRVAVARAGYQRAQLHARHRHGQGGERRKDLHVALGKDLRAGWDLAADAVPELGVGALGAGGLRSGSGR
jgi:hypothetical protein